MFFLFFEHSRAVCREIDTRISALLLCDLASGKSRLKQKDFGNSFRVEVASV